MAELSSGSTDNAFKRPREARNPQEPGGPANKRFRKDDTASDRDPRLNPRPNRDIINTNRDPRLNRSESKISRGGFQHNRDPRLERGRRSQRGDLSNSLNRREGTDHTRIVRGGRGGHSHRGVPHRNFRGQRGRGHLIRRRAGDTRQNDEKPVSLLSVKIEPTEGYRNFSEPIEQRTDSPIEQRTDSPILKPIVKDKKQKVESFVKHEPAETLYCTRINQSFPEAADVKKMSQMIELYARQNQVKNSSILQKQWLSRLLGERIASVVAIYSSHIIGSTYTGFCTERSDMDLTFLLENHHQVCDRAFYLKILQKMHVKLRSMFDIAQCTLIRARFPIVRLVYIPLEIQVDIGLDNAHGIRNSHLMRCYNLADSRVRQLLLSVKRWASWSGTLNPRIGLFSSYGLCLLLVHYLQMCDPPVVPVLQRDFRGLFAENIPVWNLAFIDKLQNFQSSNEMTVAQLFCGFFTYYSNLNFAEEGISVRLGGTVRRATYVDHRTEQLFTDQYYSMCVEEPFSRTNVMVNIRPENLQVIKEALELAATKLSTSSSLEWMR